MAHAHRKKQTKPKGERKQCISPRSGAIAKGREWKPGESGNPAGSSAKQRMRAAFEKLVTDDLAEGHVKTLMQVARDPEHPQYAQAVGRLHSVLGLSESETQNLVVRTELALEDRRDGEKPKVLIKHVSQAQRPQAKAGPDAELEIEV